jgi:hypothetical protein
MRSFSALRAALAAALLLATPMAPGRANADTGDPNQHQATLARPIPLGVSGGSISDSGGAFCCGGTLGGLVQDAAGTFYVLSNNHVLGRINAASPGEDVIQPGLIDQNPVCASDAGDAVADLSEFVPITFDGSNLVDAATAQIRPGRVDTSGTVLDIGAVSSDTTDAAIGMNVQKSGRTTGLTHGSVADVDVTVTVQYPKKCGAGGGKSALMTDQIRITPGTFSDGGDSGSVIFEEGPSPRAVGLLFAGSPSSTVANKIGNVLCAFSVPLAMAGGTPACGGCLADADCAAGEICCGGACAPPACLADAECSDGDACTTNTCGSPGTCTASCTSTSAACGLDDGCCGPACSAATDPNCAAGSCGDGICDGNGEDCFSCPSDCRCTGKNCSRGCCGDGICAGERPSNCSVDCATPAGAGQSVDLEAARAAKRRHSAQLLAIPDVVGHGVTVGADGTAEIVVYLTTESAKARRRLPSSLDGVRTRAVVTGRFEAY